MSQFPRSLAALSLMAAFEMTGAGTSLQNVEYSHPDGRSLQLDGFVPEGPGPFPAVIIVHGGAWVTGDRKASVQPLFAPLASSGFAWFSISYRLANMLDSSALSAALSSAMQISGA